MRPELKRHERLYAPFYLRRLVHIQSAEWFFHQSTVYEYFHIEEYEDGKIVLEPRELAKPFQISKNSLSMMDSSVQNLKAGNVSAPLNLSSYTDIN